MFIGLDQSTTKTGVAVYSTTPDGSCIYYGLIRPTGSDWLGRIEVIVTTLLKLMEQWPPTLVFIEEPFYFSKNSSSLHQLLALEKIIKWELYKLTIPFQTIATKQNLGWPAKVGVAGTKEHFAEALQPYCPTTFVPETHTLKNGLYIPKKKYKGKDYLTYDVSDAIGVLCAGLNITVSNLANIKFSQLTIP
jgi:Holliday junction resolvasome RuvABC endonuclease subunit